MVPVLKRASADGESPRATGAQGFDALLRLLRPALPRPLLDGDGWERVRQCAASLPASVAGGLFGFEFALRDPRPACDLLVSVPPVSRLAADLARTGARAMGPGAALGRFVAELGRQDSTLAKSVETVALEYDVASAAADHVPAPGVFLCRRRGCADPDVVVAALDRAVDRKRDAVERRIVEDIHDALPAGAAVRWAGAFPGRTPRATRLMVRGLNGGTMDFLAAIGWTGDRAATARILADFGLPADSCVVCLDVAAGVVGPRLGLEVSRGGRVDRLGWERILNAMSGRRWCLPEKAAALAGCQGAETIFGAAGLFECHRGINHVKIVVNGDAVAAKGYLACVLRRVP